MDPMQHLLVTTSLSIQAFTFTIISLAYIAREQFKDQIGFCS